MSTREVMRHPVRAVLIAPLTVIPFAILVIAVFLVITAPLPPDGILAMSLFAAEYTVFATLAGYLFAGLYAVPVLMAGQIRQPLFVLVVALIPVAIATMLFQIPPVAILVIVLLAVMITFAAWDIGGRPKHHKAPGDDTVSSHQARPLL